MAVLPSNDYRRSLLGKPGDLLDAEDHELRGSHDGDPDMADQPPVLDVVLAHRGLVTADEERLLGGAAEQRAGAPLRLQEPLDRRGHAAPGVGRVRLEHDPLGAALDGRLEEDQRAPDIDVLELRVAGHGAGTPDADAAFLEAADQVDAARVEE